MLNDFYENFSKNNHKNDNVKADPFKNVKAFAIVKQAPIKEFAMYKKPHSNPIKQKEDIFGRFNKYRPHSFSIKEQGHNPFEKIFGFKFERKPEHAPLPSAYQYKSILKADPFDIAMDKAEVENYLEEGEYEKAVATNHNKSEQFYESFKQRNAKKEGGEDYKELNPKY